MGLSPCICFYIKTVSYTHLYDKLFGEFKNMLKRELTKEEKKVINAAYNMGRKNKYLLNTKNNKNT